MNTFSVGVLFLCTVITFSSAADKPGSVYTTKYDNINLDEILASKRLVSQYVVCLVNGKPCTPEGQELRKILPEALKTKCAKCTPKQKEGALKVIKVLQTDYPVDWKKLSDKWDPTGQYFKEFQDNEDVIKAAISKKQ